MGKDENESYLAELRKKNKQTLDEIGSLKKIIDDQKSDAESMHNALRDRSTNEKKLSQQTKAANKTAKQMLEEKTRLGKNIKQLQAEKSAVVNKNEELSGKLSALSSNISIMAEDKADLEEKLERSSKMMNRYKNVDSELDILRQENNALKLEQTKNNSALSKIKQEQDASQLKHGQKTAVVGMLEEQVADLSDSLGEAKAKFEAASYDLAQKEEEMESTKQQLENVETALKGAQSKAADCLLSAQQNTEKNSMQKSKIIKTLKAQVDSLQTAMKKKSATAQKMIKEKEVECAELRKTNNCLQGEVNQVSLSDKRIFELAAHQSNREVAAVAEIDIRNTLIERLSQKVEEGDGNLARAELTVVKVEDQVEGLARVHRREGVNMDYLKSIVVQYLAKPPGSSERSALLPVLATLLQFDAHDYKSIEEGKDKVSWWGDIIPTYINGHEEPTPSTGQASPSALQAVPLLATSAEVTVSNVAPSSQKHTSLQF